jgi:hypothetical protein
VHEILGAVSEVLSVVIRHGSTNLSFIYWVEGIGEHQIAAKRKA